MKLTVVTATYNAISSGNGEALIRCIESVERLSGDHEHLIYDGASTDGTVDLLRGLEEKSPGLRVVSERDTGIYNALNKGVRDACGEWLYVLGCDDFLGRPEVLDRTVTEASARGLDVVFSPIEFAEPLRERVGLPLNRFFVGTPFPHQGMLARTALIRDAGGFDESYRISADHLLMRRLIDGSGKITLMDSPYAVYGRRGISTVSMDLSIQENRRIVCEFFGFTSREVDKAFGKCVVPFRTIWRYLLRRESFLRHAAISALLRLGLDKIGMIGDDGAVRRI